jgi:hypothetical protein
MEKITEQELQELKNIQKSFSIITYEIGQLEIEKILLNESLFNVEKEKQEHISSFNKIKISEEEFIDRISKKYNGKQINIETGELV